MFLDKNLCTVTFQTVKRCVVNIQHNVLCCKTTNLCRTNSGMTKLNWLWENTLLPISFICCHIINILHHLPATSSRCREVRTDFVGSSWLIWFISRIKVPSYSVQKEIHQDKSQSMKEHLLGNIQSPKKNMFFFSNFVGCSINHCTTNELKTRNNNIKQILAKIVLLALTWSLTYFCFTVTVTRFDRTKFIILCCLFSLDRMAGEQELFFCGRQAGTSHAIVIVFRITWSRVRWGQGTTPNKSIWDVMREQKEAFEKWRLHLHGAHAAPTSARPQGCALDAREDQHLHPDQWDTGQEESPNRQLGL